MRPVSILRALLLALAVALCATATAGAAILPLPSVQATTKPGKDGKKSALIVETIRINYTGKPQLSCARCNRIKGKLTKSIPRKGVKVFRGVNWKIRAGRSIELRVTKRGFTGRFVRLTRKGSRLVYGGAGCLAGKRRVSCPRGTPSIKPGTNVVALDSDDDGLIDKIDLCPAAAGGASNNGCPGTGNTTGPTGGPSGPVGPAAVDTDGDGLVDSSDDCPADKGPQSTKGCPDADGDGVADKSDTCPAQAGVTAQAGCPDGDNDDVKDSADACPTEAGPVSTGGCPDGDKDGVKDSADACPTVAGQASAAGCPDGDGDGIKDSSDACPTVAGHATGGGCHDGDGDGVKTDNDACPTTFGHATAAGCPDPDGDGIKTDNDACPTTFGHATAAGCPDPDGDGVKDEIDKCDNQHGGANASGCPPAPAPYCPAYTYALKNADAGTGGFDGYHERPVHPSLPEGDVVYEFAGGNFLHTHGQYRFGFPLYAPNTAIFGIRIPADHGGNIFLYINYRAYRANTAGDKTYCADNTVTIDIVD